MAANPTVKELEQKLEDAETKIAELRSGGDSSEPAPQGTRFLHRCGAEEIEKSEDGTFDRTMCGAVNAWESDPSYPAVQACYACGWVPPESEVPGQPSWIAEMASKGFGFGPEAESWEAPAVSTDNETLKRRLKRRRTRSAAESEATDPGA